MLRFGVSHLLQEEKASLITVQGEMLLYFSRLLVVNTILRNGLENSQCPTLLTYPVKTFKDAKSPC